MEGSEQAKELLKKYLNGTASNEEQALIETWQLKYPLNERAVLSKEETDADLAQIRVNLIKLANLVVYKKLWPRIAGIAAAIAVITLGTWLYYISYFGDRQHDFSQDNANVQYVTDFKPGKNTATLTLANGRVINLSDTKTGVVVGDNLRYNDGTEVALLSPSGRDVLARDGSNNNNPLSPQGRSLLKGERSRVQMLTASTPRGGTYQVTLPDGTRVWLNADSKINFPSRFSGLKRNIVLKGEAYFEVVKDKKHPFIVETDKQKVEVLGTHFNVNAYPDEGSVRTTLIEGSVRVAFGSPSASRPSLPLGERASAREGSRNNSNPFSPQGGSLPGVERSIVLKPNQQSVLQGESIKIRSADVAEVVAWKNGIFQFNDADIETIMRQISRWYNVEIVYKVSKPRGIYQGQISRNVPASKVLEMLSYAGIKFKIEGEKIIITE